MDLAAADNADPQVRAVASLALRNLASALEKPRTESDQTEIAHRIATREDIQQFLLRPDAPRKHPVPPPIPPGPPI
jgi:hypothetical protein